MPEFNVNNIKVIALTTALKKVNKVAFPRAVRHTLNELAFQDKARIPQTAKDRFITRNKTLFKSHTGLNKVGRGRDVNKMYSEVGLHHRKNDKLIEGLSNQETGGVHDVNKTFAHEDNRIGKNRSKKVKGKGKYSNFKNFHDGNKAFNYRRRRGSGTNTSFVAAAAGAIKANKKVFKLSSGSGKTGVVYRVDSIKNTTKTKRFKIKVTKLYNYRIKNKRNFKKVNYMLESALYTHKSVPKIYKEKAEFQFRKAMKI